MEQASTLLFSKHWDIYQGIIANNYMLHREIAVYFERSFEHIEEKKGISVLDLGCGDAGQIAGALKLKQVEHYTGYDLSQPALDLARANLRDLPAIKKFVCGQMEVLVKQERDHFQLIYSSYAIHHLQDNEKKQLLTDACRRLAKGGIIIIVDVFRKEGQSRDEYLDSYINWMGESWTAIDLASKELVWEHVRQFDFPTTIGYITAWSAELGLTVIKHFSPDGRHHMLTLKKDRYVE